MNNSSRRYVKAPSAGNDDAPLSAEQLIERAVDEARKLPDYSSDDEESTARHDAPIIHVHVEQPSQPEIEAPRNQLHGALGALGIGIGTALGAALAGLVERLRH